MIDESSQSLPRFQNIYTYERRRARDSRREKFDLDVDAAIDQAFQNHTGVQTSLVAYDFNNIMQLYMNLRVRMKYIYPFICFYIIYIPKVSDLHLYLRVF